MVLLLFKVNETNINPSPVHEKPIVTTPRPLHAGAYLLRQAARAF